MMHLRTLAEGLGRYLGWWLAALVRWRDPLAPMTFRRAVVLLLGMPLFLLVQLIHAVCLLLDELLFPGYRKVVIKQPLFVTGIPRSGTTFLHRTLAIDHERYTTLTTWEALLAPSIVQRKIIHALAWLDKRLGGLGQRSVNAVTRRLAGGLDDIHEVGLEAAEEDYLALLPVVGAAFESGYNAEPACGFSSAPGTRFIENRLPKIRATELCGMKIRVFEDRFPGARVPEV